MADSHSPVTVTATTERPSGFRRSSSQFASLPQRSLSVHEKAGLAKDDAAAEVLYSHPSVRIFSFQPPTDALRTLDTSKKTLPDADYPIDAIEILPWRSRTETQSAKGRLIIEKVQGSVHFLKAGTLIHTIMRNSQCWCVDGESKFVMRVGKLRYQRIEFPTANPEDTKRVDEFKLILGKILKFEKTPCPFIRGFHVDLPDDAITPRRRGTWKRKEGWIPGMSDDEPQFARRTRTPRTMSMRAMPPTAFPSRSMSHIESDRPRTANTPTSMARFSFQDVCSESPTQYTSGEDNTDSDRPDSESDRHESSHNSEGESDRETNTVPIIKSPLKHVETLAPSYNDPNQSSPSPTTRTTLTRPSSRSVSAKSLISSFESYSIEKEHPPPIPIRRRESMRRPQESPITSSPTAPLLKPFDPPSAQQHPSDQTLERVDVSSSKEQHQNNTTSQVVVENVLDSVEMDPKIQDTTPGIKVAETHRIENQKALPVGTAVSPPTSEKKEKELFLQHSQVVDATVLSEPSKAHAEPHAALSSISGIEERRNIVEKIFPSSSEETEIAMSKAIPSNSNETKSSVFQIFNPSPVEMGITSIETSAPNSRETGKTLENTLDSKPGETETDAENVLSSEFNSKPRKIKTSSNEPPDSNSGETEIARSKKADSTLNTLDGLETATASEDHSLKETAFITEIDSSSENVPIANLDDSDQPAIATIEISSTDVLEPPSEVETDHLELMRTTTNDDVQSVLSTDSFHTSLSDDDTPFPDHSKSEILHARPFQHRRELSEMTVTAASLENHNKSSLEKDQSSTVVTEEPFTQPTTPGAFVDNSSEIRQRLRLRHHRSLSPLPPASILQPPSPTEQHSPISAALIQKAATLAVVKPIEVVVFVVHILVRIASGATMSDLINGDLFRRPGGPRRTASGTFETALRGRAGRNTDEMYTHSEDEDDYGLPVLGRRKNSANDAASFASLD